MTSMDSASSSPDFQRVREVFGHAQELPHEQRAAYLEEICGDNTKLRDEVLSLLEVNSQLDTEDQSIMSNRPVDLLGREIGSYRLIESLGQGGMGEVYLGRRIDEEVDMTVSIKLVKSLFISPERTRLLRHERQILADLNHPHIATLLDAGTTPEGFPYFIMEFIDGATVDQWYASQKPGLREFLELFRDLADAVGFAHARGIIHRDIKPGNLMVSKEGVSKLVDFGIALPLSGGDERTESDGKGPMTPQFASPEQIEGLPLTHATDFYSLGLVMLDLLLDLPMNQWHSAPAEMVSHLQQHSPNTPEMLGYVLRRMLARDLSERYASAEELVAGLDSVLSRLPAPIPEEEPKSYEAFLWYHPDDHEVIERLWGMLTEMGIGLHPLPDSRRYDFHQLDEAAKSSEVCLACLGVERAPWREDPAAGDLLAFRAPFLRLLPLLLPGTLFPHRESELPVYLRRRTWLTFPEGFNHASLDSVVHAIRVDGNEVEYAARPIDVCPYRGLEAFREQDRAFFMGREAVVQRIMAYLVSEPGICILGPSGSGKSSVIQAGVTPLLRQQGREVFRFTPGALPMEELAISLECLFDGGYPRKELYERLLADSRSLHFLAGELDQKSGPPCLVIDQFEELFTLAESDPTCGQFVANLCAAIEHPSPNVQLILTMRSDFLGRVPAYPGLNTMILDHALQLEPMCRQDLERVVVQPARMSGLSVESELLARILDDVCGAPGMLPLLEHALLELFQQRRGNAMTLAVYHKIGGIEGALAQRAEGEFERLTDEAKDALRRMFTHCLIHPGIGTEHTRRPATRAELLHLWPEPGAADGLLETWMEARLLTAYRDEARGVDMVVVAHEALIRKWPRIPQWMAEEGENSRLLESLRMRAMAWEGSGREQSHLPSGALLHVMSRTLDRFEVPPDSIERAFVLAGQAREQGEREAEAKVRRRLRRRKNQALLTGAAALVLATISFIYYLRADSAEQEALVAKSEAVAQSQEANLTLAKMLQDKAGAELEAGYPKKAWVYSLAALAREVPPGVDLPGAIGRFADPRMQAANQLLWTSPVAVPVTGTALRSDGDLFAMAGTDYNIRLLDTVAGKPAATLTGHLGRIEALAFSPDGDLLVSGGKDQILRLWSDRSGIWRLQEDGALDLGASMTHLAFSTKGDRIAAVASGKIVLLDTLLVDMVQHQVAEAPVNAIAFSPNGERLAFATKDGLLGVLHLASGHVVHLAEDIQAKTLVWRDLGLVAGGDDGIHLWSTKGQIFEPLGQKSDQSFVVALATRKADGALASLDNSGILVVRDGQTGEKQKQFRVLPSGAADAGSLQWDESVLWASLDGGFPQMYSPDGSILGTLSGHSDLIWSVAFSPDKQRLASGSADSTIRIWLAGTGRPHTILKGHVGPVFLVAWHVDGSKLASASTDGDVVLWDTNSWEEAARLSGHNGAALSAAFSPTNNHVATTSGDHVLLWDAVTYERIAVFPGFESPVRHLAFSSDGGLLAAYSKTYGIKVWDTNIWENHVRLATGLEVPNSKSLIFEPGTRTLYWGTNNGQIYRANLSLLSHHEPDKRRYSEVFLSQLGSPVNSLDFSPDGSLLAIGFSNSDIQLWDMSKKERFTELSGYSGDILQVDFSPEGDKLVSASYDKSLRVWSVDHRPSAFEPARHESQIESIAFSPKGKRIASATKHQVKVWDTNTGRPTVVLEGQADAFYTDCTFSPGGDQIATTSRDGLLRLFNAETGALQTELKGHWDVTYAVDYSPDGTQLVTGSADRTIMLWDLAEKAPIHTFRGHEHLVRDVAFSPNGKLLASTSFDKTVGLWDPAKGARIADLRGHFSYVHFLAFSPDGSTLVTTSHDRTARLWDVASQKLAGILSGFTDNAESVGFSPDGRLIAATTVSGDVYLWDAQSLERIAEMHCPGLTINPLAFSPREPLLFTIREGRYLWPWRLENLSFFINKPPGSPEYKTLLRQSLNHFGYRLSGSELLPELHFSLDKNNREISGGISLKR